MCVCVRGGSAGRAVDDIDDVKKDVCRASVETAELYLVEGRRYGALQRERIALLKAIGHSTHSTDEAMRELLEIQDLLDELGEIADALRPLAGEAPHPTLHLAFLRPTPDASPGNRAIHLCVGRAHKCKKRRG
jgi:hypothetical protein